MHIYAEPGDQCKAESKMQRYTCSFGETYLIALVLHKASYMTNFEGTLDGKRQSSCTEV